MENSSAMDSKEKLFLGTPQISILREVDETLDDNTVMFNRHLLSLSKQFNGIVSGITVGILGVQGLSGFLIYILLNVIGSIMVFFLLHKKVNSFFFKQSELLYDNFLSGFVSFILFWTLTYDILYIF